MTIVRKFRIKMKPGSGRDDIPYFTSHTVSDTDELPDLYDQLIDLNTATVLLTITGEIFMGTEDVEIIEFDKQLMIKETRETSLMKRQRPRGGFPWWNL